MAGQFPGRREVQLPRPVQFIDLGRGEIKVGHAGPARVRGQLGPVLLRGQADGGRLDPQREILADEDHVVAFGSEAARDRQYPCVVVTEPEAGWQHLRVGMVQLDPDGPAEVADREVVVQAPVRDPEIVQVPQGLAGEETKFGVVAFGLQFGDDHDGQDHAVLGEPADGRRVGEQDAGVQDISTPPGAGLAGAVGIGAGTAAPR